MARLDRHMQRLESLRRRLGFIIDALCIRQIASCVLSIIPVRRTADGASVRIRCWSDILAYEEIFTGGIYDSVFDAAPVATYCDLGCQSGMAILRLVNRSGPPACSLLIDGNPRAVARCRENVREAGIRHAVVVHGAVGCGARDRPAILSSLARALFEARLVVHSAHIATYGERAVDTFYITDLLGAKIEAESRRLNTFRPSAWSRPAMMSSVS